MAGAKIESVSCCICGTDVSLRDCKIDERSQAVHEECHVARTKREDESPGPLTKRQVS